MIIVCPYCGKKLVCSEDAPRVERCSRCGKLIGMSGEPSPAAPPGTLPTPPAAVPLQESALAQPSRTTISDRRPWMLAGGGTTLLVVIGVILSVGNRVSEARRPRRSTPLDVNQAVVEATAPIPPTFERLGNGVARRLGGEAGDLEPLRRECVLRVDDALRRINNLVWPDGPESGFFRTQVVSQLTLYGHLANEVFVQVLRLLDNQELDAAQKRQQISDLLIDIQERLERSQQLLRHAQASFAEKHGFRLGP